MILLGVTEIEDKKSMDLFKEFGDIVDVLKVVVNDSKLSVKQRKVLKKMLNGYQTAYNLEKKGMYDE